MLRVYYSEAMKLNEMKYEMLEVVDEGNLSQLDVFVLKIEDWQFEPFFKKGDFLLFTKQNDIEIGQLGVYLKGDRFFIKQKGNGILRSLNVNIPDEPLTADWECIGKFYGKAQLPK